MSRVRLSELAQSDLDGIWLHVAQEASLETADRLIDEIVQRFELLSRNPAAGHFREELAPGVRSFSVGNYLIYYRDTAGRVLIARVLHGSRDQQTAFHEHR